ncbi:unnamed protein product [Closterium sp. Naga37s-1]|nr:unnamed protein product [Closterium sp. Naga37s-1]
MRPLHTWPGVHLPRFLFHLPPPLLSNYLILSAFLPLLPPHTRHTRPFLPGLGNQLLSLVSSFTYALLTNRTLLINPECFPARLLCNPFPYSSWAPPTLNRGSFNHMRLRAEKRRVGYNAFQEPGAPEANTTDDDAADAVFSNLNYSVNDTDLIFFCSQEQERIAAVRFLALLTEEYVLPGLYLVSEFDADLERLFPDRLPLMHVGRYLLHPANYLWEEITRAFRAYLAPHQRRVGIQIRDFTTATSNEGEALARVLHCAANISHGLPPTLPHDQWRLLASNQSAANSSDMEPIRKAAGAGTVRSVGVLVASLKRSYVDALHEAYVEGLPLEGYNVAVTSLSHEGEQKTGDLLQLERALKEMWLLSMCDLLLVSDSSTFGYMAAGLAGLLEDLVCGLSCNPNAGSYATKSNTGVIMNVCSDLADKVFAQCKGLAFGDISLSGLVTTADEFMNLIVTNVVKTLGVEGFEVQISSSPCFNGTGAYPPYTACCDPLDVPATCPANITAKYGGLGDGMDLTGLITSYPDFMNIIVANVVKSLGIANFKFEFTTTRCFTSSGVYPANIACCDPLSVPATCPAGSVNTTEYADLIGRTIDPANCAASTPSAPPSASAPGSAPLPSPPPTASPSTSPPKETTPSPPPPMVTTPSPSPAVSPPSPSPPSSSSSPPTPPAPASPKTGSPSAACYASVVRYLIYGAVALLVL